MDEAKLVARVPADVYERIRQKAAEQGISINTLLVQALKIRIGSDLMKYRIERIHIPAYPAIAREGDEGRELTRRIIHVFGEVPAATAGGGRVLEVLTEEDDLGS